MTAMPHNISPQGHGLGWRRQSLDSRDHIYAAPPHLVSQLPDMVDLRPQMPDIYDQGQLGSCVANAVACLLQFERARQNLPEGKHVPSRLAIYYGARQIEHAVESDAGSEIRDAIKYVARTPVPFEDGPGGWPYDIAKFRDRPPVGHFKDNTALQYRQVPQSAVQLMASLAEGWPVAFGFNVYSGLDDPETAKNDFSDPASGRLIMPRQNEASLGGHAVVLAGYDYPNQTFLVRNSWGNSWGLRGFFLMPFSYVCRSDLASDFWTISL
jgi:C1A family cysteine protease